MKSERIALRGRDALAYIVRYLNLGQVIKDGNELMLDDALNFFRGLLDECEAAEAELEKARPLMDFADKIEVIGLSGLMAFYISENSYTTMECQELYKAILAYRERKGEEKEQP
jgi:hypothetical protein